MRSCVISTATLMASPHDVLPVGQVRGPDLLELGRAEVDAEPGPSIVTATRPLSGRRGVWGERQADWWSPPVTGLDNTR